MVNPKYETLGVYIIKELKQLAANAKQLLEKSTLTGNIDKRLENFKSNKNQLTYIAKLGDLIVKHEPKIKQINQKQNIIDPSNRATQSVRNFKEIMKNLPKSDVLTFSNGNQVPTEKTIPGSYMPQSNTNILNHSNFFGKKEKMPKSAPSKREENITKNDVSEIKKKLEFDKNTDNSAPKLGNTSDDE